jgi:hypothetical protein
MPSSVTQTTLLKGTHDVAINITELSAYYKNITSTRHYCQLLLQLLLQQAHTLTLHPAAAAQAAAATVAASERAQVWRAALLRHTASHLAAGLLACRKEVLVRSSSCCLCGQHACTADLLDLLLCQLAEELGLDHHGLLRQLALAQHLVHAVLGHVNHWGSGLVLGGSLAGLDQQQQDSRKGKGKGLG